MHAEMRTSILFTLVVHLACAVAQSLQSGSGELSVQPIDILEVRRVNRPSTTNDQDHNVKIVLSQLEPLPTRIYEWSLKLVRQNNDNLQTAYSVQAQDPYQTEVEFEADLNDITDLLIEGKDSDGTVLAKGFTQLDPSFLSSRVARVGSKFDETVSSLRVWRGDMDKVTVGSHQCSVGTPCYYLSTILPLDVPRCVTVYNMKQCDDFITYFQEFNQSPRLNIALNDTLTVHITLERNPAKMEAVVFDPQDPSKIFSPENYECQLEMSQGGEIHCQQQLKDSENLQELMVLLVSLDDNGFVLGSKMQLYGGPSPKNSTGIIVGSVIGGVFGVALLTGAAVYIIKKKKGGIKENSSSQGTSSARYDAVSSP